uniref:Uncharacterized protein n=1 Tax=Acrobeloides nanus TaxID=290746 RepID=A0A914CD29_9BILA
MKILSATLVVLTIYVACIHARYTYNSGSQLSLDNVHTQTANTKSDPKLKEGVVNWIKDQFDPELVKIWYESSISQQTCIQRGLTFAIGQIEEQNSTKEMEFIENYCPSDADAVEKFFRVLRKYIKKAKERNENFLKDMPDSIRVPIEKINKRCKWLALSTNKEDQYENYYQISDAYEEILIAPEADRKVLAKENKFLAPFVTGNLRSETLQIIQALKKIFRKESIENKMEVIKALKTLIRGIKIGLMDYFESYTRSETNLPEDIDRQFTRDIGNFYDINYDFYAAFLYELDTSVEAASNQLE